MRIVCLLLLFGLAGCFGSDFMKQEKGRGSATLLEKKVATSELDSETIIGSVAAGVSYTQIIEASPMTTVSGTKVSIAPGTLTLDTDIYVQEAVSLANERLLSELGVQNSFITSTFAVSVQPAKAQNPLQPMVLSIPIPSSQTLNALGTENLAVLYRYVDKITGDVTAGMMVGDDLEIKDARVYFRAKYFGVFQVSLLDKNLKESQEAASTAPILTKKEQKELPPLAILNRTPLVVKEGDSVVLNGNNIRPTMFLAFNGARVTDLTIKSDTEATFTVPESTRMGLTQVVVEQDGTVENMNLVYTNPGDFPVITLSESEVCNGWKFYNLHGDLKTGTKSCNFLPAGNGSPGQILTTDGAGNVSWANAPSGSGTGDLQSVNNLSDIADASAARINLGLGNAALKNVGQAAGTVAAGDHSHDLATSSSPGFMSKTDKVRLDAAIITSSSNTVTSAMIADGTISDGDISSTAAIATSKLNGDVTNISNNGLGALATKSQITSSDIMSGIINDTHIDTNAMISGSKINPNFGSQDISTSQKITGQDVIANGYVKLQHISGAPIDSNDCNSPEQVGRIAFSDFGGDYIYICTGSGWAPITIN